MASPSESEILDALRPIQDPDFKRSIVDLGFVKNVRVADGRVSFNIGLTTPACPVKERFQKDAREAVARLPGVREVEVTMTAQTRGSANTARPEGLEKLAQLQKEYNNGEPERRGDERNYQKYLDRTAEMKAAISRKESDIAAIKRELAKLPAS